MGSSSHYDLTGVSITDALILLASYSHWIPMDVFCYDTELNNIVRYDTDLNNNSRYETDLNNDFDMRPI